jgi:cytochrome c oxidase subunit 4
MSAEHEIDISKHVRAYILVFVTLMALTIITVTVSYLDLPTAGAIVLALAIAGIKGSLVAAYFMHLISERKLIYVVLAFTLIFFLAVLFGPLLTNLDEISL